MTNYITFKKDNNNTIAIMNENFSTLIKMLVTQGVIKENKRKFGKYADKYYTDAVNNVVCDHNDDKADTGTITVDYTCYYTKNIEDCTFEEMCAIISANWAKGCYVYNYAAAVLIETAMM